MKEGDRDKTEAAKTRKGKTEARNTNGDGDAKQDASDETKHVNKNNSADTGSTCDTKFVDNDGKNSPTQGKSDQPAKDTENKDGDGEGDHHGILDDSGTTQNAGDDKTDNDDNNDRDDNEDTNDGGDSSGLPLSLPFATLMRDQQSYNEVMEVLSGFDKAFKDTVEEQITRLQSSSSTGAATTTASASAGSPSASRGGTDAASLASGMQALSVEKKKAPDAVYYSCKKCRKLVFSESDVTTHVPQGQCDDPNFNRIDFRGKQWHTTQKPAETKCSSYFLLDGPRFRSMASGSGADARETDVEKLARGDMQCPNPRCRARIGQFAWSGAQCSCGDWVVPALQVTKSKVDLKIRKQVPGISSSQIRRVTRERLNVRLQVIDKRDTPGQVQPVTAGSAASLPATV